MLSGGVNMRRKYIKIDMAIAKTVYMAGVLSAMLLAGASVVRATNDPPHCIISCAKAIGVCYKPSCCDCDRNGYPRCMDC